MAETIKAILPVDGLKLDKDDYQSFEGFAVETDAQTVHVLVSDQSCCCESWGSISIPDDPKAFIGAELLGIEVVDTALDKAAWDKEREYGLDEGGVMFVNFNTDRGVFQLSVYNAHNGYYGHTAKLISKQLTAEESL